MYLQKFLQTNLPPCDISEKNAESSFNKQEIIATTLNQGDKKDLAWLFSTYRLNEIKAVVRNPGRGFWSRDALYCWTRVLSIKLPKVVFEAAIFDLNPRPNLMQRYFNYLKRMGKVSKTTLRIWKEIEKLEKR